MKTVSLRTLLREPLKVKQWTRAGLAVRVTDQGEALWIIQAAGNNQQAAGRRELEEDLAAVMREAKAKFPLSRIILESRR